MNQGPYVISLFRKSAALALAILCGSAAWALDDPPDEETVFVTDVDNQVLRTSGSNLIPVFSIPGSNFRDLIVTSDFAFIIANHTQSGTVLIADQTGASRVITSAIQFPEGLDMGPDGAVYVSTESDNKVYKLVRNYNQCPSPLPSCSTGGYELAGSPFPFSVAGATRIADVAVVWSDPSGMLDPGDIVVAVAKPASLLRYGSNGSFRNAIPVAFDGEQPSALTFGPGGTLLVTTEEGSIFQFSTTGGAPIAKVGGASKGKSKAKGEAKAEGIVFGVNGGAPTAFVTFDPGKVQSYGFDSSGALLSDVETSYSGSKNPHGVSFAAAGGAALAAGNGVTVLTPAGRTIYEAVDSEGQANASCYFFEDVPGLRGSDGYLHLKDVETLPQFLRNQFQLNDVLIPNNVQGFVPFGGSRPLFRLCVTKTTAGVTGIKEIHSEEEVWLNRPNDPIPCPITDWAGVTSHANSYYAPEIGKQEYPIVDWAAGPRVIQNVTTGCGSDSAWSRGRGSLVVLSAQELLLRAELVARNLHLIYEGVTSSSASTVGGLSDFIDDALEHRLRTTLKSAKKAAYKHKYKDVVEEMNCFLRELDDAAEDDFVSPGVPVPFAGQTVLSPDVRAELKVRAAAIRFQSCSELSRKGRYLPQACMDLVQTH